MPMNYSTSFQCKHLHEHNDLLFHLFADHLIGNERGVSTEGNMWEALVLFIWENLPKVQEISEHFLRRKGIAWDEYIQYISVPGNRGDELVLHLLCIGFITA